MASVPTSLRLVRPLVLLVAAFLASCGGGYTFFQTTGAPVRGGPDGPKAMRYISRYEVLDGNNRTVPGKPRLYGLRMTHDGKDVLPPRYTSLVVMWRDVAIGKRQGADTWERYDLLTGELSPLPFADREDAVGSYSGAHYSGQRMNEVQHQVGVTTHADGRSTAWFLDHDARITAKIENVAALPFKSKMTRAQEAFGDPQPIHYFGPDRYLVHHQDEPDGQIYALFRDQEGEVQSPRLPPLVWHFGGPVSPDAAYQEKNVRSLASIVVDAERDLYWPLTADGGVFPMPKNVFGVRPVSDPRDSHTFAWFILREVDGEEVWSLHNQFDGALEAAVGPVGPALYAGFDVTLETRAWGTDTVELPTALVRNAGVGAETWQALRWNPGGFALSRLKAARPDLEVALRNASIDARLAAQRLAEEIRQKRREAERRAAAHREAERGRMLELMATGKREEAEALAFQLGDHEVSMLANRFPDQVSLDVLHRMRAKSTGARYVRWNTLIAARSPSLPSGPGTPNPAFNFYVAPRGNSSYSYTPSTSNGTSERIGRIYDQARFKTRMSYLRGDQTWHLD